MGMGFDTARHLLHRAGFGARLDEIQALESLTVAEAVDTMLSGVSTEPSTPLPDWADEAPPGPVARALNPRGVMKKARDMGMQLKAWWIREMVVTPSPLTERMTLFWHNHFTSSLQKVKWAPALLQQNQTLRKHATGSFREL